MNPPYPSDAQAKAEILDAGRKIYQRGLVAANDGNLSVRVGDNSLWVTPTSVSKGAMTEDMLVKILQEPKNAIIKQYKKLLAMDEVDLVFDEGALRAIAKKAKEKKVGARALRAIIEEFMLDIMYEIPKDDNIGRVTITEEYVEKKGGPLIEMRGLAAIPEHTEG